MKEHPNHPFGASFDLAAIRMLVMAFEQALEGLGRNKHSTLHDLSAYEVRQVLAKDVLKRFVGGERDPERLAQGAPSPA